MITLIVDLFPRLEDLKIRTKHKEILPVIEHLLLYKNNLSNLFCLCIFEISTACVKSLDLTIKAKKLLDDYLIKLVDRDLYLWCSGVTRARGGRGRATPHHRKLLPHHSGKNIIMS